MTVTVTDRASGECETTVNAQVKYLVELQDFKCGCNRGLQVMEGSSVSLSTDESTTKNYDGEDNEVAQDDVENNGEQQANVQQR